MKKIINNRYELTTCTATAASIGDTTRQSAIFFHDVEDTNRDGDGVIFGYTLDEISSADDIADIGAAFSTDAADLKTVEF